MKTSMALRLSIAASALICSSAQGALFRAYLASDGSDANPCTLQAPCRLLPAALNAVADGGEIWMLDSANYNTATVTINKSVSVLAVPGVVGSVVAINSGAALSISADNLVVGLRNLVVSNFGPAPGMSGIVMTGASRLTIEGSLIAGLPNNGVLVIGNGTLRVTNTTIRDNGEFALYLLNGATGVISEVKMLGNVVGGVFARGNVAPTATSATVSDSLVSGGSEGISAGTNIVGATARIAVTRSTIERTETAALVSTTFGTGTTEVSVSNSLIVDNAQAWYQLGAGSTVLSQGNNHLRGNGGSTGAKTAFAGE